MKNKDNMHFSDYIAQGLRRSADELEKFQLQASLGKMEALEKYQEMKKTYAHYTHEVKLKAIEGKEDFVKLIAQIQDLQVQFELGKADTIDEYEAQKKKILLALHELQVTIKTNPTFIKSYAKLLETLEQINLKLAILSDKLDPLKEKVKDGYDKRKKEIESAISSFKAKFNDKTDSEHKMEVFQDELAIAYKHFKKAFVQS
jgi:hypothetical protein